MAEQVELIDYLRVIGKRKWLIVSGTVGCVLAAAVVSLILPKEYETSLQLTVARVWGNEMENPRRVVAIINSEPFLDKVRQKANLNLTLHEMKRKNIVSAQTSDAGTVNPTNNSILVNVVTRGSTPEEAVKTAGTVGDIVISEHQPRFKELLEARLDYERKLENQIQLIQKDVQELDSTIRRLSTNPQVSAPAVILLQAQLEQKQSQLVGFLRELRDVKLNNTASELTQNTRVVLPPVVPQQKASPRIAINVVIAGIVGLIATLAMVFFLGYLERVQLRESGSIRAE